MGRVWLFVLGCIALSAAQDQAVHSIHQASVYALEGKSIEATQLLYAGLEKLGNHAYADSVMKEIWDIMTLEERQTYPDTEDKGQFLALAWKRRDPSPATPENERYMEHTRRLHEAKKYFPSPQPRGYDDRGMIWIRYGKPDMRVQKASGRGIRPNEAWAYYRYSPPILINFSQWGALFRMNRNPYDFALAGDAMQLEFAENGDFMKSLRQYDEYLEMRVGLHPKYDQLYSHIHVLRTIAAKMAQNRNDDELRGAVGAFKEAFMETDHKFNMDFDEHPHVKSELVIPGELTGHINTARFMKDGKTQLELYIGIPFDQLTDSTGQATLRFSCAVTDDSLAVYDQRDEINQLTLAPEYMGRDLAFTAQLNVKLPPGPCVCALSIGHSQSKKILRYQLESSGFDAAGSSFYLSDIQKAANIQIAPMNLSENQRQFIKYEYLIQPYAFQEFNYHRTLFIYLEAYNLSLNSLGYNDIEITWKANAKEGFFEKINPFGGKSYSLSSSFHQSGKSRTEPIYVALDIAKLMPGPYEMEITVLDKISGIAEKSKTLFIVKEAK